MFSVSLHFYNLPGCDDSDDEGTKDIIPWPQSDDDEEENDDNDEDCYEEENDDTLCKIFSTENDQILSEANDDHDEDCYEEENDDTLCKILSTENEQMQSWHSTRFFYDFSEHFAQLSLTLYHPTHPYTVLTFEEFVLCKHKHDCYMTGKYYFGILKTQQCVLVNLESNDVLRVDQKTNKPAINMILKTKKNKKIDIISGRDMEFLDKYTWDDAICTLDSLPDALYQYLSLFLITSDYFSFKKTNLRLYRNIHGSYLIKDILCMLFRRQAARVPMIRHLHQWNRCQMMEISMPRIAEFIPPKFDASTNNSPYSFPHLEQIIIVLTSMMEPTEQLKFLNYLLNSLRPTQIKSLEIRPGSTLNKWGKHTLNLLHNIMQKFAGMEAIHIHFPARVCVDNADDNYLLQLWIEDLTKNISNLRSLSLLGHCSLLFRQMKFDITPLLTKHLKILKITENAYCLRLQSVYLKLKKLLIVTPGSNASMFLNCSSKSLKFEEFYWKILQQKIDDNCFKNYLSFVLNQPNCYYIEIDWVWQKKLEHIVEKMKMLSSCLLNKFSNKSRMCLSLKFNKAIYIKEDHCEGLNDLLQSILGEIGHKYSRWCVTLNVHEIVWNLDSMQLFWKFCCKEKEKLQSSHAMFLERRNTNRIHCLRICPKNETKQYCFGPIRVRNE